jgi:hypothetical protein
MQQNDVVLVLLNKLQKQTVLKLNMPVTLINKFTINSANQVVSVGSQDLVTLQSDRMKQLVLENGQARENATSTQMFQPVQPVMVI